MNFRNIAIIAHVDHGKTTLVDYLLRQAGTFEKHQVIEDRVMDSADLEKERGITIFAKNTAVRIGDVKINIVDTPGHADFGGEVERVLGMVDGAILLVDASEGPLPQTRFVLKKALAFSHLRIILVINKVDRIDARIDEIVNETFELFMDLGANEKQLDFPIVYACAKQGWCTLSKAEIPEIIAQKKEATLEPLFQLILEKIPSPSKGSPEEFKMLVSHVSYSDYLGRLAVGRISSGQISKNQKLTRIGLGSNEKLMVTRLFTFEGLKQVEVDTLHAGEIGVIAGCENVEIGDTLVDPETVAPLPRIIIEKPTLGMIFCVNTSPLCGKEGKAIQSRSLKDRLLKEVRNNVALSLELTDFPDRFRVLGRGELQFAILIEQMRREGLEFMVGKPNIIETRSEQGERLEPIEKAILDIPQSCFGEVSQLFQTRKGVLIDYQVSKEAQNPRAHVEFEIPVRGLLGIRSHFLTITRGEGYLNTLFLGYQSYRGTLIHRNLGALISDRVGEAVEYALLNLEPRGTLFIQPGTPVYKGMIIGEHHKPGNLSVNPCKEKKLTNMRASHAKVLTPLAVIREMSLERCIEWIDQEEWIEITPKSIRLRKDEKAI